VTTITIAYIGDYYSGEQRDRLIAGYTMIGSGRAPLHASRRRQGLRISAGAAPFLLYLVGLLIMALAVPTLAESELGRRKGQKASVAAQAHDGSIRNAFGIYALILVLSIVMYTVDDPGPFMLKAAGIVKPSLQSNILMIPRLRGPGSYSFAFVRPRLGIPWVRVPWYGRHVGLSIVGFAVTAEGPGAGFLPAHRICRRPDAGRLTQSAVLNVCRSRLPPCDRSPLSAFIFSARFLHPFAFLPLHAALGVQAAFLGTGAASWAAGGATILWQASRSGAASRRIMKDG